MIVSILTILIQITLMNIVWHYTFSKAKDDEDGNSYIDKPGKGASPFIEGSVSLDPTLATWTIGIT